MTKLASDLTSHGVAIWLDFQNIEPGSDWNESIQIALKKSSHVLIVWSMNSVASPEVLAEVFQAKYEEKTIIQARIDDCRPPAQFNKFQSINFHQDFKKAFDTLISLLPHLEKSQRLKELRQLLPQNPYPKLPQL